MTTLTPQLRPDIRRGRAVTIPPENHLPVPLSPRRLWREDTSRHAVDDDHGPHLLAAIDWLCVAQDVTPSGGFARGYSQVLNHYFALRGWEPDYAETTGYIIPTMLAAADRFARADLETRALRAAEWEFRLQLASGAVPGGVVGEPPSPSVFNTGQAIFGWLAAHHRTGEARYADAARAAARFLVASLDADGIWRRGHSRFAVNCAALYNARTAWALAEAARRLDSPACRDAAARCLHAVARRQHSSGWLPDCCVTDPSQPLLHTLAYAIRGLLEGGRMLDDSRLLSHAATAAAALADSIDATGRLAGRFAPNWRGTVRWSCLTGQAQMVGIWLRLYEITGDDEWLEPVVPAIRFLKSTQDRTSTECGIAGGIAGSEPIDGGYAPHETLSWATKFFIDALMRHERVLSRKLTPDDHILMLA